jgi:hypothetical protein
MFINFFLFIQRTESTTKQTREDKNSKKNDDEDENQVEKPLLDSLPQTEVKQPKKKVIFSTTTYSGSKNCSYTLIDYAVFNPVFKAFEIKTIS